MISKDYKNIVFDELNICLKPFGFNRKGNSYLRASGDLAYYISLQSSTSSTSQLLKLTLNIEIASAVLAAFDDQRMPIHLRRHYNMRIGQYLDEPQDKWFLIDSVETARTSCQQITQLIIDKVIPEFESLKSAGDLISRPSGLTNFQMQCYVKVLSEL